MSALSYEERLARLDQAIETNEIKRGQWAACLLSQLSPEVEAAKKAVACPSDVMPRWLAYLTPSIDDKGSLDAWPSVVLRYALLAHRWPRLTRGEWQRVLHRVLAVTVTEAMRHTYNDKSTDACRRVICLLTIASNGETVSQDQWEGADKAAWEAAWAWGWAPSPASEAAAWAAAKASEAAAWAAAKAADAALWTAAGAAEAAGTSAVRAAWMAADAAAAAVRAATRAAAGTEASAWDRMIAGWLDAIDASCTEAEARR